MIDDLAPPDGAAVRAGAGRGSAAQGSHGRHVVVRDRDGRRTAVTRRAVSAVCETEEGGALLLLPGGRMVHVEEDLDTVLGLLA